VQANTQKHSKPCVNFGSNDLEKAIVREVLNVLKAPPIEMLRATARASESEKQARLSRMESELKRLANEERAAQERVDLSSRAFRGSTAQRSKSWKRCFRKRSGWSRNTPRP
jgi:hypothetical protein